MPVTDELDSTQAARSTLLGVIARISGAVCGAVALAATARTVPVDDFGAVVFAVAIVSVVGALSDFGSSTIGVRELARHPQDRVGIVSTVAAYRLVGVLVLTPAAVAAGWLVEAGSQRAVYFIVLATVVAHPWTAGIIVPLAELRVLAAQIPMIAQSVTWTGLALVGAWFGWGTAALALSFTISAYVQLAATMVVSRTPIRLTGIRSRLSPMWKQSREVGLSSALFLGYHKGDVTVVQGVAGTFQTALYGGAYRLIDVGTMAAHTLFSGLLPALTRRQRNPRALQTFVLTLAGHLAVIGGFIMVVSADYVVNIVYGSRYDAMAPLVQVGAVIAGAFVFEVVLNQILVALNVTKPQLWLSGVTVAVQFAAAVVAASYWGALGVVVVSAVVQAARAIVLAAICAQYRVALPLRQWTATVMVAGAVTATYLAVSNLAVMVAGVVVLAALLVTYRPRHRFRLALETSGVSS